MNFREASESVIDHTDIEEWKGVEVDGVYLMAYGNGVINISPRGREVANEDLDTFREVLKSKGYREVRSWVAAQGASWLSDDVTSVSFHVTKVE